MNYTLRNIHGEVLTDIFKDGKVQAKNWTEVENLIDIFNRDIREDYEASRYFTAAMLAKQLVHSIDNGKRKLLMY